MKNLSIILEKLRSEKRNFKGNYFIPEMWNSFDYSEYSTDPARPGEINVNPYDFMIYCIENCIAGNSVGNSDNLLPLGCNGNCEVELSNNIIYSMFPRMLTSWNHFDSSQLCPGTLLKAICFLPYLKKMNVSIIYLLPVFEYSDRYKKGEIGSPYSIRNIYKIDRKLHDDLLGENSDSIVETEFKAFVEACHILGMQVMVDFVFRTVARDSDIIVEHPEWFYWINLKYNDTFCVPLVESEKELTPITEEVVSSLYTCSGIDQYLSQFTHNPKDLDSGKWEAIVKRHIESGENILNLIEQEFGITTAPAFPPVINDPQPPWPDVTYLRFYLDLHNTAKQFVSSKQPPFVLPDIAKASVCGGQICNTGLWDYTANVIPYFQKNFGIDGARIDMGHALPPQLNKDIISKAKEINPNFIFWSEEFDTGRSYAVKDDGFHFMTGYLWSAFKYVETNGFYEMITSTLLNSVLPLTSALETPDTPRSAFRYKEPDSLKLMILLSCFIPNAVPMINNGMEIVEIQPMNLGLENTEQGRLVLDEGDPMYGKLAFFDNYRMHWTNPDGKWMQEILINAADLRKRFADLICNKDNFIYQSAFQGDSKAIGFCYIDRSSGQCFFIIVNRDNHSDVEVNLSLVLPEQVDKSKVINLLYKDSQFSQTTWSFEKVLSLPPKNVIIGIVN